MLVDTQFLKTFIFRLYRFLEEGHTLKITKLRMFSGKIDFWLDKKAHKPALVTIDHRTDILSTLIHEFLHYQYPELSEDKVIETEHLIVNKLSQTRVKNILKKFSEAL
jgi:hypothetical protein